MRSTLYLVDVVRTERRVRPWRPARAGRRAARRGRRAALADLGVDIEHLPVVSPRPAVALLEVVEHRCRAALVVLATDQTVLRRFRRRRRRWHRRFIRVLAEQTSCLLWIAQEPNAAAASSAARPSSRAKPTPMRRGEPGYRDDDRQPDEQPDRDDEREAVVGERLPRDLLVDRVAEEHRDREHRHDDLPRRRVPHTAQDRYRRAPRVGSVTTCSYLSRLQVEGWAGAMLRPNISSMRFVPVRPDAAARPWEGARGSSHLFVDGTFSSSLSVGSPHPRQTAAFRARVIALLATVLLAVFATSPATADATTVTDTATSGTTAATVGDSAHVDDGRRYHERRLRRGHGGDGRDHGDDDASSAPTPAGRAPRRPTADRLRRRTATRARPPLTTRPRRPRRTPRVQHPRLHRATPPTTGTTAPYGAATGTTTGAGDRFDGHDRSVTGDRRRHVRGGVDDRERHRDGHPEVEHPVARRADPGDAGVRTTRRRGGSAHPLAGRRGRLCGRHADGALRRGGAVPRPRAPPPRRGATSWMIPSAGSSRRATGPACCRSARTRRRPRTRSRPPWRPSPPRRPRRRSWCPARRTLATPPAGPALGAFRTRVAATESGPARLPTTAPGNAGAGPGARPPAEPRRASGASSCSPASCSSRLGCAVTARPS